jgi:hypothetical protein
MPDKDSGAQWGAGVLYVPIGMNLDSVTYLGFLDAGGVSIKLGFNEQRDVPTSKDLETPDTADHRLVVIDGHTAAVARVAPRRYWTTWYREGPNGDRMLVTVTSNAGLDAVEAMARDLAPGVPPAAQSNS